MTNDGLLRDSAPRPHWSGSRPDRGGFVTFWAIVGLFLVYAGCFIYRTSFTIAGERYFSLFDDAMISMRYARNLAHGNGLVWNPGTQPVEGYTNPLWLLYMAAIHLLPLSASKTSLLIQLTAAALLAVNLFFVREMALRVSDGSKPVILGAVLLTASYLPINNWSLQGMEVSVLVLIVSVCVCLGLRSIHDGRFRASPYVLLGASTLVRPDMVVPLAGLVLFHVVTDSANRWRHLAWGSGALVFFAALQTAFRLWYFGDILPNTYYLKMTGYPVILRISRGAFVLARFIWKFNVLLFALPFLLLAGRDRRTMLLLWMLLVQMLYSVYVGGDAWEYWGGSNRYICIAMPGFFVVLSYALFRSADVLLNALHAPAPSRRNALVFAALIGFSIVSANSIYGVEAWTEVLLIHTPLHTGNGGENHQEVQAALMLRTITTPDAVIAVTRAGTIPYFSDRQTIDLLGKNDRHVAREPSRVPSGLERFVQFRPGHMKFDYRYSIEGQSPDVIVQLWHDREEVRPYLENYYTAVSLRGTCVYVRDASTRVLWDKLPGPCRSPQLDPSPPE
jgi:arabinofuranosyltransferase